MRWELQIANPKFAFCNLQFSKPPVAASLQLAGQVKNLPPQRTPAKGGEVPCKMTLPPLIPPPPPLILHPSSLIAHLTTHESSNFWTSFSAHSPRRKRSVGRVPSCCRWSATAGGGCVASGPISTPFSRQRTRRCHRRRPGYPCRESRATTSTRCSATAAWASCTKPAMRACTAPWP